MRSLAVWAVDVISSVIGAAIDAASELWDVPDDDGGMWEDEE